ncbi:hypothetical protein OS493_016680 [Desmophyllum pertusum]|uniref:G-protein coupled receptors family 1 profile domain-containing protein n=1 Tax=Desmophyllum pertusum TaxID=174260 RepID=A0A9X0CZP9_9CNID|nr:hypothetical protein OS493_016680 [Desmophyllum pertusum]
MAASNESYINATTDPTELEQSLDFWIIKIVCYCIILLGSSMGNSLVIYIIASNARMRTPSNYLIMNLAMCDFVTPMFSIPFDFILEEYNYTWMYGARSECREVWPGSSISFKKYYTLGLFLVQYFIPLTFMMVMYSLALKNLYVSTDKTSSRKAEKEQAVLSSEAAGSSTPGTEPKLKKVSSTVRLVRKLSSTVRRGTNEANKRATKMFIAIVVVFTICMFPNQVLWLWADFANGGDNPKLVNVVVICWLFTYSNSVCNPVIYALFSRDFRRGFKRAFRKAFCLRHRRRHDFNPDLVATLTTELKSAATDIERRKRKIATVEPPRIDLL